MPSIRGKVLQSCAALFAGAMLLNACVVGVEARATHAEAAAGPPHQPLRRDTAAGLLAERPGVSGADEDTTIAAAKRPRQVAGYYHWNGVAYVYRAPQQEPEAPAFRWR